jgi:hypothetical protein
MSETVLILRAQKYDFVDEKTGRNIRGAKITYVSDDQIPTPTAIGNTPFTVFSTPEVFDIIQKHNGTGMYEITIRTKPGKEGQATVQIVDVKHVREVSLAQLR